MLRKLTSITLLVSVIAVGVSGVLMILLGSFRFQLQMHPVHKVFGILMCVSALIHVYLNFKPIKGYLKNNKIAVSATVLGTLLFSLSVIGMNKPLDQAVIDTIERQMAQLEK